MPDKSDYDIYADFSHRYITEGVWPYIGGVVQTSISKLEAEGFTREEATFWIECLTTLQLYRMDYPMGPVIYRYLIEKPPIVYYPGER